MSRDQTRQIITQTVETTLAERDSPSPDGGLRTRNGHFPVMLLNNPAGHTAAALNTGLTHGRGRVVILIGGHCEVPQNYVSRCVEVLRETGADCVGGCMATVGENRVARSIAMAQSSFFGVGGAAFRTGRRVAGWADTVAFGAYRREVFERIGAFDERMLSNVDNEFNFRLIRAGGTIWLDPSINAIYYCRASLQGLWRQYFRYGFYKVRVLRKHGNLSSWRYMVPPVFVAAALSSSILALSTHNPLWLLPLAGLYVIATLLASLCAALRDRVSLPLLPLAFMTIHAAFGVGFWAGWISFRRSRG
jgi:hypothetical protein